MRMTITKLFQMIFLNDNNEILNSEITENEILKCIRSLKDGTSKATGNDQVINEYIKVTSHLFMPIYLKLFSNILNTGFIPDGWLKGIVKPIFKNKGDRLKPENYRPITILSCIGKLFTCVLNTRLTTFLDTHDILNENQAGFRKEYSTVDHTFVLNTLIETLKNQKKKLFCAFIDFSQAFNSVWRIGLWRKLLGSTVQGKLLRVIYNMYSGIKSCVSVNNECSGYFISNLGVRQGENLAPVLFCIYLNDLEDYLSQNRDFGVLTEYQSEEMFVFVKIGVLSYADDTLLLAESEHGLQYSLDLFNDYCRAWKLKINHSKGKVVIFGARNVSHFKFYIGQLPIETTDHYKYLGIYFSKSGSFLYAKRNIVEQAKKKSYVSIICKNKQSQFTPRPSA